MKKHKEFFYVGYYEILNVTSDAATEQIKSAFRKLAHIHHPDKNNNTAASHATFILISNAYNILTDPVKRKEYDTYLKKSTILQNRKQTGPDIFTSLPGRKGEIYRSNEVLLNHFNFLLWEIEDIIRRLEKPDWKDINTNTSVHQYILDILAFIDKWVLGPAGFPDYFMEARKKRRIDPVEYVKHIGSPRGKSGHQPYVNITDYFYDIRKRMDRFLAKTTTKSLLVTIPGYDIRLFDCIIEAQNYAVHFLSYLLQMKEEVFESIPPFEHSHSCF